MDVLVPATIRWRLVATYGMIFIVLIFPLVFFVGRQAFQAGQQEWDASLEQQTIVVADSIETANVASDQAGAADIADKLARDLGIPIALVDRSGALVYSSSADTSPGSKVDLDSAIVEALRTDGVVTGESDGQSFSLASIDAGNVAFVLVGPVSAPETSPWPTIWSDILPGLLLATGLVALFSWLVAGRIAGPLEELARQARSLTHREFLVPNAVSAPREIRELASSFNQMDAHVDRLIAASEHERSLLETIFDNLNDGVIVVSNREQVILVNRSAMEKLGVHHDSKTEIPLIVAVRDHDLITHFRNTMSRGVRAVQPIQYTLHNRLLEATVIPVIDSEDGLGIIVVRDVTELRRLESTRREFVANVSHELRTPLASIRALADTLEEGAIEDKPVAYDFAHRIIEESDRLARLVDELLDLSALESGTAHLDTLSVRVATLLDQSASRFRKQVQSAELDLQMVDESRDLEVEINQTRIEQVFINLIHNAIKFTPAGGMIQITAVPDGSFVKFSVSDTGMGIPEEDQSRIFERFYKSDRSRTTEGTGLGLAISKHIVQAHGGEIWVEKSPTMSATISFTLPVAKT